MELSGQLIKGTGSYEIKEIAPIVSAGNLITSNWDFSDGDTGWDVVGDSPVFSDGKVTWDGSQSSYSYIRYAHDFDSGQRIRFRLKLSGVTAGWIRPFNNYGASAIDADGVYELYMDSIGYDYVAFEANVNFVGSIEWIIAELVPEGYPLIDKGTKYLECTSAGTVAIPSDQAYGEWEWDTYKASGSNRNLVLFSASNLAGVINQCDGYAIDFNDSEVLQLLRCSVGSYGFLMASNGAYLDIGTWYRIKITRTPDGEFYVYIKGGEFGNNDWTLADYSLSGSNPVTNNTHTTSKYFVLDFDAGDRIANLVMRKAVKQ